MSESVLQKAGPRPVIRLERRLARPVDAVWRAVTDTSEMKSWFPTRIEIDEWKVGAEMTHHFDEHNIDPLPGRVLEWDPPRRVGFTWGEDSITFELTADGADATVFVLTEELSANAAARNAAGWDACLDRLASGAEADTWQSRFDRYSAEFTPVLGQQEGPPAGYVPPEA